MKWKHIFLLALATSSLAHAAPGAHGPNGEHLDMPAAAAPGGLARLPDGSVSVPMPAQRRMGLRTLLAIPASAHSAVELPARVVMHPHAGAWGQPLHSGRVQAPEGGLPLPGQTVNQGQILAWIEHPTAPREPLPAPMSGTIARSHTRIGQVVTSGELLFEIIDPQQFMVEATTPDTTLPARVHQAFLREAPDARLHLHSNAHALREGVLPLHFSVVYAPREALNHSSSQAGTAARGMVQRFPKLALGQPVTVIAQLDAPQQGYVLPASALVRNAANETIVWIKSGTQRYIAQVVRAQALDATSVLIVEGLGPDNRVVVQGAALLAQIR